MLQRQRGDISGAAAVMKGHWTMTRPSRLLLEWPLSSFLPLSRSTSLSRWHFGKPHCHTTFNKARRLRRAAGDGWPDRAQGWCAEYPSCLACWPLGERCGCKTSPKTHKQVCASMRTDGTSAHQHADTLVALNFLSFFPFLSLPGYCVYTHSTSPLTIRRLLPLCCQRSPG